MAVSLDRLAVGGVCGSCWGVVGCCITTLELVGIVWLSHSHIGVLADFAGIRGACSLEGYSQLSYISFKSGGTG